MTTSQLRNKMRRLRETKEAEAEEEGGELNLVPYLDIVTNVVIFLLASVTYMTSLSNVNVSSPTYATGGSGSSDTTPTKPPLNLTINVSQNGFILAATGGVLKNEVTGTVPTVPRDPGSKDLPWAKLTEFVHKIKEQYPDEHNVILTANPEISYETIIHVLDAVRGEKAELFPDVSLSSGVL